MQRNCFFFFLTLSQSFFLEAGPVVAQAQVIQYREKPSLKSFAETLKKGPEIAELIKKTQNFVSLRSVDFPEEKIQQVLKPNLKSLNDLKKLFLQSGTFVRGEIDDEKVLNSVLGFFQLSQLQIRSAFVKAQDLRAQEEIHAWMMFAADLPYEEASLVSLRLANVFRSLLLDDLELLQKKHPTRWGRDEVWLQWSERLRASWPIDRIILTESKKVLNARLMKYALEIAAELQKNSYQSMQSVLEKNRGGKAQELQFLKSLWRDEDIQAMKTEVTRISAFRLRLAKAVYEQKTGEKLQSLDSLISAKLIAQIPVNYLTGKPFDLAATALE